MSSGPSRFLGVTEEIGSRGEIEVFHLDTEEDSDGALLHTVDDVVEVWKRERRPLGAGGFGVAWLERSATGKVRVVKEVKKVVNTNVMTEYWLRELSAMALLHRNTKYFPEFYGWFHDKDYVYIAMEHVNQGDLRECVNRPLSASQSQSIAKQVAHALRILHKKGITHRDLKPANILVRQGPVPSWRVIVTDFGISKRVRDLTTGLYSSFGGDTTFMAPEILDWANGSASDEYTNAVDMWSLGCLAYWLLKMNMPVPTSRMVSYCRSPWAEAAASVDTAGIDETGKHFILSLINPDPNHRMNADDACLHAWLMDVSLHPAVTSSNPKKHNAKIPQEERTRVTNTPHNVEERTSRQDDSEYSLTQLPATYSQQKRNMSSSELPVLGISSPPAIHPYRRTPNPDSSEYARDSENRSQSPQRESRQREASTNYSFRKEDDAARAQKAVAEDSAPKNAVESAYLTIGDQNRRMIDLEKKGWKGGDIPRTRDSTRREDSSTKSMVSRPPPPQIPSHRYQFVTALYDFDSNNSGDLAFKKGDRIKVLKKTDRTNDWWQGELKGIKGVFPANFVLSDSNQDDESFERPLRNAQDYSTTTQRIDPSPPLSRQEPGVQTRYWRTDFGGDRRGRSDMDEQYRSNPHDLSRRSEVGVPESNSNPPFGPIESASEYERVIRKLSEKLSTIPRESRPSLPTQTSAPAPTRTPLGIVNGAPHPVRLGQDTRTVSSGRRTKPDTEVGGYNETGSTLHHETGNSIPNPQTQGNRSNQTPLQKLEVTLNDITKEEKRARVQEAAMRRRRNMESQQPDERDITSARRTQATTISRPRTSNQNDLNRYSDNTVADDYYASYKDYSASGPSDGDIYAGSSRKPVPKKKVSEKPTVFTPREEIVYPPSNTLGRIGKLFGIGRPARGMLEEEYH